ncbi:hypothetical protein [Aestuariirhabdus litorea]|uniref:Uncharacterized protein n=1 Tax=Aestuariirhabdus litorea TaxID=2528527 RepID=A0A3P3VQN8_9GAMM|nr:hypothetical protein [Aestuariirhabdus litorea]RRJ85045.1 hypothetical protein D0544_08195 [Aestuariirhabdus litorea]RWW98270.1 hypothetical protein DZC74_08190 [Endozoicomonadaceae bacterium GTF-13]
MFRPLLLALLLVMPLVGCAQIEQQNREFPLSVNTQLVGNRITVTVYSPTKGVVREAQIQITDDIRRLVLDKPLGKGGQLTFRVPSQATELEIIVTDADGDKGRARLFGDDLRENEGCNRILC